MNNHASDAGIPRTTARGRGVLRRLPIYGIWQIALVGIAFLIYFGVRGLTAGDVAQAEANARSLVRVERAVGLAWEESLQAAIDGSTLLVNVANWVYIWGHLPLLAITAFWLYFRRTDRFLLFRDAVFISGLVGMVIFATFPMAPPRLGILEVLDTVTERSSSYRTLQPPALTNKYAAFPSLHFGWNLLLGMIMAVDARHIVVKLLWAATPVAMAFAVVATANHYVLDVVFGALVALLGYGAAIVLRRRNPGKGTRIARRFMRVRR
jgi:membrane-associated phospholipid phosphatase